VITLDVASNHTVTDASPAIARQSCRSCVHSIMSEDSLLCLKRTRLLSRSWDGLDRVKLRLGDCGQLNPHADCTEYRPHPWGFLIQWGERYPWAIECLVLGAFVFLLVTILYNFSLPIVSEAHLI